MLEHPHVDRSARNPWAAIALALLAAQTAHTASAAAAELAGRWATARGSVFTFERGPDGYRASIENTPTGRRYRVEDVKVRGNKVVFYVVHEARWDDAVIENAGKPFRNYAEGTIGAEEIDLVGGREGKKDSAPWSLKRVPLESAARGGPPQYRPDRSSAPTARACSWVRAPPTISWPSSQPQRRGAGRRHGAAAGHLHDARLLSRPRALVRSALFPLQRAGRPRDAVGRQRGADRSATIRPRTGAWGYCDRDYPREQIVSPYPFKTAKAHYEALLAEAAAHGGPTIYTRDDLPRVERQIPARPHEDGVLVLRRNLADSHLPLAAHARVPNSGSCSRCTTTPPTTRRSGRARTVSPRLHAPIRAVLRPARRSVIVTPELVQILNTRSRTSSRTFTSAESSTSRRRRAAARAGRAAMVRRDRRFLGRRGADHLDVEHPGLDRARRARVQQQAADVEIYTPRKDAAGAVVGIDHEAVLYDRRPGRAGPDRAVLGQDGRARRRGSLPVSCTACRRTSRSNGVTTPVPPGNDVRVHGAGYLRAAVGADLGEVPREGHAASEEKKAGSGSDPAGTLVSDGQSRRIFRSVAGLKAAGERR